jgi:hypothetical protein
MISSERSQNVIVLFIIILTAVSSLSLVYNAQYYSSSYELAARMNISFIEAAVSDIDPTNESIYPHLSFKLNFRTDATTEGNVRLVSISGTAWLNDDLLSYTDLSGIFTDPANQILHPNYNVNFTLAKTTNSETDRSAILLAYSTDTWNWYIRVRYEFITFGEISSRTRRTLYFNWTGPTTIL